MSQSEECPNCAGFARRHTERATLQKLVGDRQTDRQTDRPTAEIVTYRAAIAAKKYEKSVIPGYFDESVSKRKFTSQA